MATGRVSIRTDVVFGQGGGRELRGDIFTPPDAAPGAPGLLLVHGGAWSQGDKSQMRAYGIQLAMQGFVCLSSSYRLTPEAAWPAQIHDVKTALRYMRAHADGLGIDPELIASVGASAGGHLVLLAAGTVGHPELEGDGGHAGVDTSVRATVGIFAPTVLSPRGQRLAGSVPAAALMRDADDAEASALASPITHVRASYPPTFLVHGSADRVVPPSASMRMYETLVEAKVPTELHMIPDQPHGFVVQKDFHRVGCTEMGIFLRRYLGLREHVVLPPGVAEAWAATVR